MKTFSLLILLLVSSISLFYVHNSSTNRLGTDEALYIFLAKGHYESDPMHAPMGTVFDAAKRGMVRTADPPGFFVLLHFWEKISFAEGWLRTLPYLLFIVSIVVLIRIALLCKLPPIIGVLIGFLPLTSYFMNLYAIELRCYGMEVTFIFLLLWSMLSIINRFVSTSPMSIVQLSIMTLVALIGLTTRFSFIITCVAAYSSIGILIIRDYKSIHFKQNIVRLSVSFSLVVAVFLVFFLIRHYAESKMLANVASSGYSMYEIAGSVFQKGKYFIHQLSQVPQSYLGGSGLRRLGPFFPIFSVFVVIVGLYSLVLMFYKFQLKKLGKHIIDNPLYAGVLGFPIISGIISIVLALLGLHPFVMMSRWSLYLFPSFCLLVVGLIMLVSKAAHEKLKIMRIFTSGLCAIAVVYGFLFMTYIVPFRGGGDHTTYKALRNVFSEQEIKSIDYWYVTIGERSCFKYFYLYGNLQKAFSGNAQFVFENRHNDTIVCRELDSIKAVAFVGSRIAMIEGHVNTKISSDYQKQFSDRFGNVMCGPFESNAQQVCWGIRE